LTNDGLDGSSRDALLAQLHLQQFRVPRHDVERCPGFGTL
jgi:hypothetical protein